MKHGTRYLQITDHYTERPSFMTTQIIEKINLYCEFVLNSAEHFSFTSTQPILICVRNNAHFLFQDGTAHSRCSRESRRFSEWSLSFRLPNKHSVHTCYIAHALFLLIHFNIILTTSTYIFHLMSSLQVVLNAFPFLNMRATWPTPPLSFDLITIKCNLYYSN